MTLSRRTKVCIALISIVILMISIAIGKKVVDRTMYTTEVMIGNEPFTVQYRKDEPAWVRTEVGNRLKRLSEKATDLVNKAYAIKIPSESSSRRLYSNWNKIKERNAFREISISEKSAAYTVNKGDEMRICIRDKNKENEFEDENTSMFVLIHELSHLACKSWGHGQEFREIFAELTKLAVDERLYTYQDFTKNPEDYCGTVVTYPAYTS